MLTVMASCAQLWLLSRRQPSTVCVFLDPYARFLIRECKVPSSDSKVSYLDTLLHVVDGLRLFRQPEKFSGVIGLERRIAYNVFLPKLSCSIVAVPVCARAK